MWPIPLCNILYLLTNLQGENECGIEIHITDQSACDLGFLRPWL